MSAESIEGLFLKARQAIEQRDWATAKMMYLQALGLKSDLPDVHYGLATVYFQLRELTSAAHHFKEVTRLDPQRVGAFVNLGAVLNLLDHLDEAVVALRRSIQLDAKRVEGYYNLGLVYRRKGQTDLAIQAYREAIRLNPRMSDAHLNLANLLFEKEQYRQAETNYQKALELRPGWEKAIDGLEAAREAAALQENKGLSGLAVGSSGRIAKSGGSVLDQTVDPTVHATLLTNLHQGTIDAMDAGRLLQQNPGERSRTLHQGAVEFSAERRRRRGRRPGRVRQEIRVRPPAHARHPGGGGPAHHQAAQPGDAFPVGRGVSGGGRSTRPSGFRRSDAASYRFARSPIKVW